MHRGRVCVHRGRVCVHRGAWCPVRPQLLCKAAVIRQGKGGWGGVGGRCALGELG